METEDKRYKGPPTDAAKRHIMAAINPLKSAASRHNSNINLIEHYVDQGLITRGEDVARAKRTVDHLTNLIYAGEPA